MNPNAPFIMNSTKIKLSIIVLFYHGERWVDSCIHSLENQSLPRDMYELILVDNGGSTPSVEKYAGKPNISVIHFPVNYGFAGGNNRALTYAHGDIVFLLNQDAVIHHNCLEELLNTFNRYPEAGVVSANMLMVSAGDHIDQFGPIPEIIGLYTLTSLGYAVYSLQNIDKDVVPVDFVSGAVFCFRKTIIRDVGGYLFDVRLGSYTEDLDLSIRLKNTSWQMHVQPKAVAYHYRDTAFSGKPAFMLGKLVHISSNRLLVYYNNLTSTNFFKRLPALLLGIPLKVAHPDGSRRIDLFRPIIAFGFLPFILCYFWLRVLAGFEIDKTESKACKNQGWRGKSLK